MREEVQIKNHLIIEMLLVPGTGLPAVIKVLPRVAEQKPSRPASRVSGFYIHSLFQARLER